MPNLNQYETAFDNELIARKELHAIFAGPWKFDVPHYEV